MPVDYSLYLVTDSTPSILGDKDLVTVVEDALVGGVTLVQYRDKKSETAVLVQTARKLHQVTQKKGVPLLINDRLDVAQAVGAEGVHLGQEDMDVRTARQILGPEAIIGVTASSVEEALNAAEGGATYLGIGTVYATPTKTDTKSIIGTKGVREILHALSENWRDLPTVSIGSIKASNIASVIEECSSPNKPLSGVAIVSAIMAADEPRRAAQNLKALQRPILNSLMPTGNDEELSVEALLTSVPELVKRVGQVGPLCHNMTNLVVQNFAANVAICIRASPIMANYGEEAQDLANLGGALVINMGTVTPDGLANYSQAIKAYNQVNGPVLLDPVGGGATGVRRQAVQTLMKAGFFDVIKGNENEILTVLGTGSVQQKGVDSGASTSTDDAKAKVVKDLAQREGNVVLMTGKTDFLSDGWRTVAIRNGHQYLGSITGSGCTLGTTIASFVAIETLDKLLAALAGILMFEIAAELASERKDVLGPGTFVPAFLDSLHLIAKETERDQTKWLQRADISLVS